jgi:hypothetical protein
MQVKEESMFLVEHFKNSDIKCPGNGEFKFKGLMCLAI